MTAREREIQIGRQKMDQLLANLREHEDVLNGVAASLMETESGSNWAAAVMTSSLVLACALLHLDRLESMSDDDYEQMAGRN